MILEFRQQSGSVNSSTIGRIIYDYNFSKLKNTLNNKFNKINLSVTHTHNLKLTLILVLYPLVPNHF